MLFLLNLGSFIQNQILKMKWLSQLIIFLLDNLGISQNTKIGNSIHFFIYDVIKITLLLCIMIFFISYLQTYFPAERSKKILLKFNGLLGNIVAALLGTVTPFCSCSSIPFAEVLLNKGAMLGTILAFMMGVTTLSLPSIIMLRKVMRPKLLIIFISITCTGIIIVGYIFNFFQYFLF